MKEPEVVSVCQAQQFFRRIEHVVSGFPFVRSLGDF